MQKITRNLAYIALIFSIIGIYMNKIHKQDTDSTKRANLKISTSTAKVEFDPTKALGYQQFVILDLFLNTLIKKDENGQFTSGIAESWRTKENGTIYEFTLDRNSKFQDGSTITSKDVAYSISKHFKTNSHSIVSTFLGSVLKTSDLSSDELNGVKLLRALKILNPSTIEIHLKGAYEPILDLLSQSIFGILPANFSEEKPIGSGDYAFEYQLPAGETQLKAVERPGYTQNHFERINIRLLKEKAEIVEALKNSQVDLVLGPPFGELSKADIPTEYTIKKTRTLSTTIGYFNFQNELFHNETFRKDLLKLFEFIKRRPGVLTEYDRPLVTIVSPEVMPSSYSDRDISLISPEEFRSKWNKSKTLSMRIKVPMGFTSPLFDEALIKTLEEAGFKTTLEKVKGRTLFDAAVNADFDLMFFPYAGVYPDPDGFLELMRPDGIMRKSAIPSQELFSKITGIKLIQDQSTRLEKYSEILKDFEQRAYLLPLARQDLPIIHRNDLHIPDSRHQFFIDLNKVRKR